MKYSKSLLLIVYKEQKPIKELINQYRYLKLRDNRRNAIKYLQNKLSRNNT